MFSELEDESVREHTVAHIWGGSTIHISRLNLVGRQSEVCELDNNLALSLAIWGLDPSIGYDKVLRFDVPVEDLCRVTDSNSLAHLSEHGGDEA